MDNQKTEKLVRAAEFVKEKWTVAEKIYSNQLPKFSKYFRMFKSELVDSNYEGLSKVVVPKVFEKVVRGTAIINQALKKIRVTGEGSEDDPAAVLNEKLIDFENRVLHIPKIRKMWIMSGRIYGSSYLEVTWDISREEPQRPYKGLKVELVPSEQIRFNPDHVTGEPFRWMIRETNIPFSDVKRMVEKGKGFEKINLVEIKSSSKQGKTSNILGQASKVPNVDAVDTTTLMTNIKTFYGKYAKTELADEEDYIIVIANDKNVIKSVKSPYADILDDPIPIFELVIYPIPGEPYGYGDPAAIGSLYTELNDVRNQRMDTVTLNIDPMKVILKGANIDPAQLIAKRGWVVETNVPNAVQVIPPDMQGVAAAVNEEKIIHGDIDRTLGIPSFGAATPVQGDLTTDTATGVNATLQAQDVVSNAILDEVKGSLTNVYRAILAYNQTFIDRKFKITVMGEKGKAQEDISKSKIQGNLDLDIDVELVGNRLARRAEALAALRLGSGIPGTNMKKLWEDYLSTHDKYDIEEYYTEVPPEEPESPKISVSVKTKELSELQSAEIYKQIPGVNPVYADPALTEQGRRIMKGDMPEDEDKEAEKEKTKK